MLDLATVKLDSFLKEAQPAELQAFFREAHPADIAEALTALQADAAYLHLAGLDQELAAEIFCELPVAFQSEIADSMSSSALASLAENLSPDDRVDMIKALPDERRIEVLALLESEDREAVNRLAAWPEGSVGSIMTTEFVALPARCTAAQAMVHLRKEAANKEAVYNSYVVNSRQQPLGVVNLRDLILAKPESRLRDIMDDQVFTVAATAETEEATHRLGRYALVELPVVDERGAMIGLVSHDDAMLSLEREHTEDMERFMAITGEHDDRSYLRTPVGIHARHRLWWLVILAGFGFLSGAILQSFESTLMSLMILAFYMPMLADTGGNTGSQAATVVVRALALKQLVPADAGKVLWKEFRVAVLLCLVLALFAFGRIWFFTDAASLPAGISVFRVAFAISLALALQVVSATVFGALLPMLAAAAKLDPALVASPALTTIVDITGLLLYFGIARTMLGV